MEWLFLFIRGAVYLLLLELLWTWGNRACRIAINWAERGRLTPKNVDPKVATADQLRAGRVIGSLERVLIFVGIVAARWEIVAGVVALKTVARYKKLDHQLDAEYFLIGSMASVLWAIFVTGVFLWHDASLGFGVVGAIREQIVGMNR